METLNFDVFGENIDLFLAKSKGLIINNDYFCYEKIYLIYRFGLEQIISKMTLLSYYDKKINDSNLGFLEVLEEEKDYFQSLSSFKYFYLRNNLYIERLSIENIEKIKKINIENEDDRKVLIEIVMKTYKDIIIEYPELSADTIISFGFDDINLMPYNGSLIIGFRYDEYRNEEILGDSWNDNYIKQVEMINQLLPKLESDFEKVLKVRVKIIHYNEFSVKKKI